MIAAPDIFAEAKDRYTITGLWQMLNLPGPAPRPGTRFHSPFRPDENPSCDISKDDRWFADRSRGDNFDAVGFVREALGGDWTETRTWFLNRNESAPPVARGATFARPEPEKRIEWPGELIQGTSVTWEAFAAKMGLPFPAVHVAVHAGMLRFLKIDGLRCYAVTDEANRAGEIRRCDGGTFTSGRKAFPLKGVEKAWLPGADMLKRAPKGAGIFITEGPRDLLAALGLYCRYRRDHGGSNSWVPMALLGAGCKKLHPELVPWFRDRRVRIVPDGDEAGDAMADHWRDLLLAIGCTVEIVRMPRGKDLSDMAGEIQPEVLFQ